MEDWLSARRRASPDKVALYWATRSCSFRELDTQVQLWAGRLTALGVKRGQVVAVLAHNCPDYLYLTFALARLGAVLLTLNTRLTDLELRYQLEAAGASLLLAEAALLAPLKTTLSCVTLERAAELPVADVAATRFSLDTRFCLLFTSGTTGQPKAVQLSLGNFCHSASSSAVRLGVHPDDNWLCTLPLYHVGGLSILLRSCLYGTAVTLYQGFDVWAVKAALESGDITLVSLVPTQLYRLLEAGLSPHPRLRLVLLGGAAAGEDVLLQASARGLPVATTYGLTEACSQVATALPNELAKKPGTVGKPLLFTRVRVLDDAGNDVAPGIIGTVFIKGPQLMLGYLGATARTHGNGWFDTGDLGYFDAEGDLFIVQRRRDLIVSGGENVYPAEVEAVLRQHEDVLEVSVLGASDPEWGQRVAAAIVLREGKDAQHIEGELEQLCLAKLAAYKRPRVYAFLSALPLTPSGKVKKHDLLPLFEAETL